MRKIVVVMLFLALCSTPMLAARPEAVAAVEFLAGTVGGYAAGTLGAVTLSSAFAAGSTGWESLARAILGAVVGFSAGTIVGSSLGVIGAASLFGVEGNVGLCFLGAASGTGMMLLISLAFESSDSIFPLAPPVAAACAVAGFTLGASSQK